MKLKKSFFTPVFGVLTGICNGLFGAGGGIVAVEALRFLELDRKESQSTSIAVVLPLCIVSALMYLPKTTADLKTLLFLVPAGLVGAILGTFLMKKMSCEMLKKFFCLFMIYAGVRMFF